MEDFIYVVFFIIYIVFTILKKVGEKKAIEHNKTAPASPPQPKPKGIFERLEEMKRMQEQAAREIQQEKEALPPLSTRPPVQVTPKSVPRVTEKSLQDKVSYDQVKSLETNVIEPVSLEKLPESIKMDVKYYMEKSPEPELEESDFSFGFNFENIENLQQAFVLKEILDSPLAIRKNRHFYH